MLVSNRTRKLDIPHEEGEWVEIRLLSGRQLRKVRKAKFREVAQNARDMGGEVMKAIAGVDRSELKKAEEDPLVEYDMDALLEAGIVSWSYDEEVSSETIGELDPETEQFVALALVGVESEPDRKKG